MQNAGVNLQRWKVGFGEFHVDNPDIFCEWSLWFTISVQCQHQRQTQMWIVKKRSEVAHRNSICPTKSDAKCSKEAQTTNVPKGHTEMQFGQQKPMPNAHNCAFKISAQKCNSHNKNQCQMLKKMHKETFRSGTQKFNSPDKIRCQINAQKNAQRNVQK